MLRAFSSISTFNACTTKREELDTARDIDFILELAQTRSFDRAAENLYTAQPIPSHHIKAVVEGLGFQIFIRTSKCAHCGAQGQSLKMPLSRLRISTQSTRKTLKSDWDGAPPSMTCRRSYGNIPGCILIVSITPIFPRIIFDQFLKGETDLMFALEEIVRHISMVGGGSPAALRKVRQRVIRNTQVKNPLMLSQPRNAGSISG